MEPPPFAGTEIVAPVGSAEGPRDGVTGGVVPDCDEDAFGQAMRETRS